jgi:hypothetical protein
MQCMQQPLWSAAWSGPLVGRPGGALPREWSWPPTSTRCAIISALACSAQVICCCVSSTTHACTFCLVTGVGRGCWKCVIECLCRCHGPGAGDICVGRQAGGWRRGGPPQVTTGTGHGCSHVNPQGRSLPPPQSCVAPHDMCCEMQNCMGWTVHVSIRCLQVPDSRHTIVILPDACLLWCAWG